MVAFTMPCQVLLLSQNNLYVYCFHNYFITYSLPILNPDKNRDVGNKKDVLERTYIHYKNFILYNYMDDTLGSMSPHLLDIRQK